MLQRAASNAYSWWWASHIRTKQSKWLEQNLQDMGEKVQTVLKLIDEDGDSFAKRAEMYYKKRPELIHFVEESYRAYRALAERYDHISTELQNANNTIASVFPEEVQFAMEDDEDEASSKIPKKGSEALKGNIPKVPKVPKGFKNMFGTDAKKLQSKTVIRGRNQSNVVKSGLSKTEGLQEIDKLQKQILSLQTEKEFVKSSYEGGLAKYWEIEQMINELQEKVSNLQDEFGAGTVIEDDEARTLMASAALKSCQDTLVQLQEKQAKSAEEAMMENRRINDARMKLKSIKVAFLNGEDNAEDPTLNDESTNAVGEIGILDPEASVGVQEKQDLKMLHAKTSEQFKVGFNASLSVSELAEKIDEVVNKVISLEASVSSQTALIRRLRTETDELQAQIGILEDDKATLIDGKNDLKDKLRAMEEKLVGLQELNRNVEHQNNKLQSNFTEAHCNLGHLSEKLHSVKLDEELQEKLQESLVDVGSQKAFGGQEKTLKPDESPNEQQNVSESVASLSEAGLTLKVSDTSHEESGSVDEQQTDKQHEQPQKASDDRTEEEGTKERNLSISEGNHTENVSLSDTTNGSDNLLEKPNESKMEEKTDKQDDEPDWKQMFTNGMENREKFLLTEYTTALRNYKDVKKKLGEAENKTTNSHKDGDGLFQITLQLKELKSANAKKDEQIKLLRQKLSLLQTSLADDDESEKSTLTDISTMDREVVLIDHSEPSEIEQKFRSSIDEVLEENLEFWLRFSSTFHQIQKFETEIKDLQSELVKLEEKKMKQDSSTTQKYSLKSDAKPLYKHLREINAQLGVWLEKSALLKDELKSRFSSLCDIQDEITAALKASAEDDDFTFTSYQAAKFQGEILNMKQENNKVADELQAGLDHVTTLQLDVEKTLAKLNEEFKLSGSKNQQNSQLPHSESRSRIPLRSFIFGVKQKRQKHSFFSCVHPVLQRKYNGFKSGMNP